MAGAPVATTFPNRQPGIYQRHSWFQRCFSRGEPAGYSQSIQTGTNAITAEGVRESYEKLRIITEGEELFTAERLRMIAAMQLGLYDHLLRSAATEEKPSAPGDSR